MRHAGWGEGGEVLYVNNCFKNESSGHSPASHTSRRSLYTANVNSAICWPLSSNRLCLNWVGTYGTDRVPPGEFAEMHVCSAMLLLNSPHVMDHSLPPLGSKLP